MLTRALFATALLSSSLVFAETPPATPPAPTTKPAKVAVKLPTPAELAEKMKALTAKQEAALKVAYFDLSASVSDKPSDFSLFGGPTGTLRELTLRLEAARKDPAVKAVLLDMHQGVGMSLSQAQEVRDELIQVRRAGKKIFTYADTYDTTSYVLASCATDICMLEGGELFMPGVSFETMFYKGIFDKLGVYAEYVQIGEFKGAEEPYTRSEPSEELKGEMTKLSSAMYKQIVDGISRERNVSAENVRRLIDETMVSGAAAKEAGWVDHLIDPDGLRELLASELGGEVDLLHDYATPEMSKLDMTSPLAFITSLSRSATPKASQPTVAIVYADGTIVDGEGSGGIGLGMLTGGSDIGSERIRRAMREIARDENIKSVVIRINSPGGSALASEAMWQAVRRVSKTKPVVISIGGMAASGGYYLASAGDHIVADPAGIVGSIGVVGGKFVLSDLYAKLGISTTTFTQGKNADLYSQTARYDERQQRLVRTMMKNTYDQFTSRVMTTRTGKIKDIDQIARGRIFMAADALELGMVDELGGLNRAIDVAAERAKMTAGSFDTQVVPAPTTIGDLLTGNAGGAQAAAAMFKPTLQISPDSVLSLLPASTRQLIGQQLKMAELMQSRPAVLMSPYVITVR